MDVTTQDSELNIQSSACFDLQGRRRESLKPGMNIVREGSNIKKIIVK